MVEVMEVSPESARAVVLTTGVAVPARSVTVIPQVSGRVSYRSATLVPGGRLTQGAVLARIESRDYELALQQEQSRVRAAELDLEVERGRQGVAQREWELLGGQQGAHDNALALRRPHLVAREASVQSAWSGVERAKLNLARTVLRAPWNALVLEADAEPGQVVGPSSKVARLVDSDVMWIKASVPLAELGALQVPGVNGDEASEARVIHELAPGLVVERRGRIVRLEGELDPQTKRAQLVVAVERPFDEPQGSVPLLPGSFVKVELEGRRLESVYAVPRAAAHDGDSVWVASAAERLERRQLKVAWATAETLYATEGLQPGDRVVTSQLSLPVQGAPVEVTNTDRAAAQRVTADDGGQGDGK
jgi:RND family efflux transporter MFP subunit